MLIIVFVKSLNIMGIVIGIDVGISTTKIVGIRDGHVVSPIRVKATDPVTSLYGAFGKYLYDNKIQLSDVEHVMLTGVGSAYINEPVYGLPTDKANEFIADGLGARHESGRDKIIVVSMGTGTSLVKCDGDKIETVRIPLDEKLTPSQNAARYYKKYTKLKTAKEILAEQIKIAETDLEYLASVEGAVALCESEADIDEIRRELILGGYLHQSSEKGNQKSADKHVPKPARFITSGGRELICGRNNIQNDFVSMKLARKHDWWFHVKNSAGAHVIMLCEQGEEPDARDFTEAAELAAYYSSISDTQNAAVDYTLVKNLKKPSGAKPGKVVYYSNYTAYVTPKLSVKKL